MAKVTSRQVASEKQKYLEKDLKALFKKLPITEKEILDGDFSSLDKYHEKLKQDP